MRSHEPSYQERVTKSFKAKMENSGFTPCFERFIFWLKYDGRQYLRAMTYEMFINIAHACDRAFVPTKHQEKIFIALKESDGSCLSASRSNLFCVKKIEKKTTKEATVKSIMSSHVSRMSNLTAQFRLLNTGTQPSNVSQLNELIRKMRLQN